MTCFPSWLIGAARECHCSLHTGPLVSSVSHLLQRESQAVRPATSLSPEATHTPLVFHINDGELAQPVVCRACPGWTPQPCYFGLVTVQVPLTVLTVSAEMPVEPFLGERGQLSRRHTSVWQYFRERC